MKYPYYQLTATPSELVFEFKSEGPNGSYLKRIQFTQISDMEDFYNLSLLNYDEQSGEVDDEVLTRNKDFDKILATVYQAICLITSENPGFKIAFEGNTKSKTRLYQMAISLNLDELEEDFLILGVKEDFNAEIFKKNRFYQGFRYSS